jgi:hypothetical protein
VTRTPTVAAVTGAGIVGLSQGRPPQSTSLSNGQPDEVSEDEFPRCRLGPTARWARTAMSLASSSLDLAARRIAGS